MNETFALKLRVATYNVHGCVGMDRQRSEARIAEVIAQLSVDIVGLQELDLSRRRSAGVDQTGIIAEQLGWHSHFYPAAMSITATPSLVVIRSCFAAPPSCQA
jgi:endonuclease/exonuclease/phosphatase family metal-dependent hydrolase